MRLLLALGLLAAPARAGYFSASARGTSAADFLNITVGARAAGMGEAFAAVVDDANAVYWNPAAMTEVSSRSVALMHATYIDSSYFDYAAYVNNAGKHGAFGLAWQYFSPGTIHQMDGNGSDLGPFHPYDMALYWSYARKVLGFSLGASAKLIDSRILTSASAGALDVGALSPAYLDGRLRLAFTAVNLGGDTLQFDQMKENLPMALRLAAAYRLRSRWLLSADLGLPHEDRPFGALGTEFWLKNEGSWRFAVRTGFNSRTVGGIDGFSAASFGFGVAGGGWGIDYALIPFGGLGQANRLSLNFKF